MIKRFLLLFYMLFTLVLNSAETSLKSVSDYKYSIPCMTNNIKGVVMGPKGDYAQVRSEDIAWINEAFLERAYFCNKNLITSSRKTRDYPTLANVPKIELSLLNNYSFYDFDVGLISDISDFYYIYDYEYGTNITHATTLSHSKQKKNTTHTQTMTNGTINTYVNTHYVTTTITNTVATTNLFAKSNYINLLATNYCFTTMNSAKDIYRSDWINKTAITNAYATINKMRRWIFTGANLIGYDLAGDWYDNRLYNNNFTERESQTYDDNLEPYAPYSYENEYESSASTPGYTWSEQNSKIRYTGYKLMWDEDGDPYYSDKDFGKPPQIGYYNSKYSYITKPFYIFVNSQMLTENYSNAGDFKVFAIIRIEARHSSWSSASGSTYFINTNYVATAVALPDVEIITYNSNYYAKALFDFNEIGQKIRSKMSIPDSAGTPSEPTAAESEAPKAYYDSPETTVEQVTHENELYVKLTVTTYFTVADLKFNTLIDDIKEE